MPELPEVETTVRYLRPHLLDAVVEEMGFSDKAHSHFKLNTLEVRTKLIGGQFTALERTGKWMLFSFDNSIKAVGHLRMSGRFLVSEKEIEHPHKRFWFHVKKGNQSKVVNYIDLRRFGTFHLVDEFHNYKSLNRLGPDALSQKFNAQYLQSRLTQVRKPIYSALLDQAIVAGLGNIYVNEVLNATSIHPLTPANKLTLNQYQQIVLNTKQILKLALQLKGTTLIDNLYQDPEGKTGEFAKMLKVYGKKKDPEIVVLKIGGRSVFVSKKLNELYKDNLG